MRRTETIFALALLSVVLPLGADTMFEDGKAALKDLPRVSAASLEWTKTVVPALLDASYQHGKDIEFWQEALKKDLHELSRVADLFRAEPSLFKSFQVVGAFHKTEKTFDRLMNAFAGCRSCSDGSFARIEKWTVAGRRHQTDLKALNWNFEMAHSSALMMADRELRTCNKE